MLSRNADDRVSKRLDDQLSVTADVQSFAGAQNHIVGIAFLGYPDGTGDAADFDDAAAVARCNPKVSVLNRHVLGGVAFLNRTQLSASWEAT